VHTCRLYTPNMQKVSQSTAKDGNIFSRKGSIFGGGSKGPVATRPSTSSGSIGTNGPESNGDWTTSQGSSVSSTSLSSTGPSLTRKASFSLSSKSPKSSAYTTRKSSLATVNTTNSPEGRQDAGGKLKQPLPLKPSGRGESVSQPSLDIFIQAQPNQPRTSDRDSVSSTTPYSKMLSHTFPAASKPGTQGSFHTAMMIPALAGGPQSPTLETITYQHIQEMASKRISTLDYLRKAYG
jgi:hypothetical protein